MYQYLCSNISDLAYVGILKRVLVVKLISKRLRVPHPMQGKFSLGTFENPHPYHPSKPLGSFCCLEMLKCTLMKKGILFVNFKVKSFSIA